MIDKITVKKYSTVEELKADVKKTADPEEVRARHAAFEKVMKKLYAEIVKQKAQTLT